MTASDKAIQAAYEWSESWNVDLAEAFDKFAAAAVVEARKDQAEKCGAAAARAVIADGGQPSRPDIVKVACLNAVEKEDE